MRLMAYLAAGALVLGLACSDETSSSSSSGSGSGSGVTSSASSGAGEGTSSASTGQGGGGGEAMCSPPSDGVACSQGLVCCPDNATLESPFHCQESCDGCGGSGCPLIP